jgi:hypothetical protein
MQPLEPSECCPTCELIHDMATDIVSAESFDEIVGILHALHDIAHEQGHREALIQDIQVKMSILDDMDGNCDCEEDCGECDL